MPIYDYKCESCGATFEAIRHIADRQNAPCSCGHEAQMQPSTPSVKLEPFTGAFPGAYYKWNRMRKEKMAQERKDSAFEG